MIVTHLKNTDTAMINLKLLDGPFAGDVVPLRHNILDVPFEQLDIGLQNQVIEYVTTVLPTLAVAPKEIWMKAYENSWEFEETTAPPTLKPLSQW